MVAAVVVVAGAVTVALLPVRSPGRHVSAAGTTREVVIARGVIQGHPWRIVVDQAAGRLCAGEVGLQRSCVSLRSLGHLSGPAALSGAMVAVDVRPPAVSAGPLVWNALFGVVRPDVSRLALRMSNGRAVDLRPVSAAGYRWVGLIWVPFRVAVTKATAYSGARELGYSVPLYGGEMRPGTYFISWYRPGEVAPAFQERYIATGGTSGHGASVLVRAGPWGYCVVLYAPQANVQDNCWSPSSLSSTGKWIMHSRPASARPRWIVGTALPWVSYLQVTLAGGRAFRVPVTRVSGIKFYAMGVGTGPAIVRWRAFSASGRRWYGGYGAPDSGS